MGGTEQLPVVSDAGPIIHLDELGCLDLLRGFGTVLIPREVWGEVLRHRPRLAQEHIPAGFITELQDTPTPRLLALGNSLDCQPVRLSGRWTVAQKIAVSGR